MTEAARPPASWRPIELTPFLDGSYQPPVATLFQRTDGVALFYPGLTHTLAGESESGKSLIAQAAATEALSRGWPVLYLDYESDAGAVTNRLLAMGALPAQLTEHFHYVRPEQDPVTASTNPAAEYGAFQELLAQRFALVIIDGVTEALTVSGLSSLDNDEVTRWQRRIPRQFAERTGAAVISIDHMAKATDTRGRYAIGAQAKMATVSGASYIVEPKGPLGIGRRAQVELRLAKDRAGTLRNQCGAYRDSDRTQVAARVEVDSTNENVTRVTVFPPNDGPDDRSTFYPSSIMENISRELEKATGEGRNLTARQIEQNVSGNNQHKRNALGRLIEQGYVTVSRGPKNAKLHASTRPYRQAQDPSSDRYNPNA